MQAKYEKRSMLQGMWDAVYGGLKAYVEDAIAEGKVTVAPKLQLNPD